MGESAEQQRARWARLTPEQRAQRKKTNRRAVLKRTFNVTPEWYDEQLATQGGGCAICGETEQTMPGREFLPIDHDHQTGEVRGILCEKCNRGLGCFNDDPATLLAAARYIVKHWGVKP